MTSKELIEFCLFYLGEVKITSLSKEGIEVFDFDLFRKKRLSEKNAIIITFVQKISALIMHLKKKKSYKYQILYRQNWVQDEGDLIAEFSDWSSQRISKISPYEDVWNYLLSGIVSFEESERLDALDETIEFIRLHLELGDILFFSKHLKQTEILSEDETKQNKEIEVALPLSLKEEFYLPV